jgi:hypothetical protein
LLRFEDFKNAKLLPQVRALILVLQSQGNNLAATELANTLEDRARRNSFLASKKISR